MGQDLEGHTLKVLPVPDPQAFPRSNGQQSPPILCYWSSTRSDQERQRVIRMTRIPNGAAQVIVLAENRSSRGESVFGLGLPPTVRNSSLAKMLISNTRLDFCLSRTASSSFDFHVDCTSSLSAKSLVVPPKRPSWWMTRGSIS